MIARLLKFAGVSGAGLCLDYAIYVALCAGGMSAGWANAISASAGVTFVFVASARHIFESEDRDGGRRGRAFLHGLFVMYAVYQVLAITAASYAVHLTTDALDGRYVLGKAAVLPFTFATNYAFMAWLFRRRSFPGAARAADIAGAEPRSHRGKLHRTNRCSARDDEVAVHPVGDPVADEAGDAVANVRR